MNRQQKETCVSEVKQEIVSSNALFVVGVQGLSVDDLEKLRRGIRQQKGALRVVKNTLSSRAIKGIDGVADLQPYLNAQVALVLSHEDPAALAKLLCDRSREMPKLSIVAGCVDKRVIDASMVKFLGTLPPYEVLVAQACGALKSPLVAHVSVLKQVMTKFVWVLKQIQEKGGGE
jgi:large subunit ribosomal protein L10